MRQGTIGPEAEGVDIGPRVGMPPHGRANHRPAEREVLVQDGKEPFLAVVNEGGGGRAVTRGDNINITEKEVKRDPPRSIPPVLLEVKARGELGVSKVKGSRIEEMAEGGGI